ncbi:hypothetical protein BpHYR1_013862 [Brachionus plicatilis]|uniref:Uncharacterized protein n=1 Tax=Brachionus plicatilis TaxID=10195 RepID=A0A3M7SAI5_BRAPC|nr:hypothetical protein BpHYR1_013862 [Brachionus plicatilis]
MSCYKNLFNFTKSYTFLHTNSNVRSRKIKSISVRHVLVRNDFSYRKLMTIDTACVNIIFLLEQNVSVLQFY